MKELKAQFIGAWLVLLTVASVICAALNYQQQKKWPLPDDGVTWMDQETNHDDPRTPGQARTLVVAAYIAPGGPGAKAGIQAGDVLHKVNGTPVDKSLQVVQLLLQIGADQKAFYVVERAGVEFNAKVFIASALRDKALYLQYLVGIAYLAIGLFVYLRRGRAPRSAHFYLLCLASFVHFTFHYTGKLNAFDATIYVGNVIAGLLAPALFLHFCFVFPEPRRGWTATKSLSIYLPALSLMAIQIGVAAGVVRTLLPLLELRWLLDRAWLFLFTACFMGGAFVLHSRFRNADDPITRQQLKWLRNGTVFGIVPFAVLYVIPFIVNIVPSPEARLAVLSLGVIPLTWAYAILRYRLMDVDIIFQQGYVYVLATLSVLGMVYALVIALERREELSAPAVILLVLVAAFMFEPLRGWIQQQLDRYVFYKDRYDYRGTLISFARELSSETDLDQTLQSVGDKLIETLQLARVAFFLDEHNVGKFSLRAYVDRKLTAPRTPDGGLDLSFLAAQPSQPYLFFERTRHFLDVVSREMTSTARATIGALDLTYYFPCAYRGRTVAWLGASRTAKGDFLSSDDVDLLATLAGYVAMAVENTRLYRSLADKADEYERLKEFSENIVESINVGILAADLDDRVESWNTQIEKLTGIPRERAVGRRLAELFPGELAAHFEHLRHAGDVHQMYRVPFQPQALPLHANGNGNGARPEAQEKMLNVAVAPLVSKEGQHIGRLIILDDITEREDLERRLVQADKLSSIGLLAAGVAHEVNTPLAVISSYAQMLAKQVAGDEQKARMLDKIAKQTFRASEIVNSLLNFSRTSSTEYAEVDLNKLVRETLSLLEHQLEKHGIRLEVKLDDGLPVIKGSAGKLQQVFLNVFLNARDAMEGGGTLHVTTIAREGTARVEVRDDGPGIPREVLPRIFDPFFTTKGSRKGTGLGLSVSYGIVEEHGGTIEALSEPGQGACFRLDFPAARRPVNA
jgi:two-component system, NtrC family, sensor kinase